MAKKALMSLALLGVALLPVQARVNTFNLRSNILSYQVHDTGLIIARTENLYGLDPETGKKKWQKVLRGDIKLVPGSPYLIHRDWSHLRCLDVITGEEVWKIELKKISSPAMTEKMLGQKPEDKAYFSIGLDQVVIDDARQQFLLLAMVSRIETNKKKLFGDMVKATVASAGAIAKAGAGAKTEKELAESLSKMDAEKMGSKATEADNPYTVTVLKRGVMGIDMETGKVNCLYSLPEEDPPEDFVGSPPQVADDLIVLDWDGIHTFKATDGTPVASLKIDRTPLAPDTTGGEFLFELPAAPTLVDGQIAYVVAWKKLVAVDLQTGTVKWENEEVCPVMPELRVAGDKLLVRTGAPYLPGETIEKQNAEETEATSKLSSKQKNILKAAGMTINLLSKSSGEETAEDSLKGTLEDTTLIKYFTPCGLTILDKNTGQILADTEKMGGAVPPTLMTPLLIDGNTVYFGTRNTLRAIDLDRLAYKFIAKVDSATKEDVPKQVLLDDGKLYLLLSQTTVAFDPADGRLLWSYTVPAMKLDPFTRLDLAAEHAFEQYPVRLQHLLNARRYSTRLEAYAELMEVRFTAAQKSGMYNYSLAAIERSKAEVGLQKVPKGLGKVVAGAMAAEIEVVGVSLRTGKPERRYRGTTYEKDYRVDPFTGTVVMLEPPDKDGVVHELKTSTMAAGD